MNTYHLNESEATYALTRASFPSYNGRKFQLEVRDTPIREMTSYWDGGSRDYWAIVDLATMQSMDVPENGSGFTAELENVQSAALPRPGFAVVRHSIFCGKDMGLTFYLHPDNAAKFLPKVEELTRDEKIVLVATRSLKSSYAGIKDYRFHEANRDTKITRERWDAAKSALIARRLLNSAGAITTEGKNAAGSGDLYQLREREVSA